MLRVVIVVCIKFYIFLQIDLLKVSVKGVFRQIVDNHMKKITHTVEIIKGKLYWMSDDQPPKNIPKSFYFNIDKDLAYDNFNEDFGPLNLGKTWKYVTELEKLINNQQYKANQIFHLTSTRFDKAANSAFLMCAFEVIVLGYDAKKAFQPFKNINFRPFRDAGYAECSYKCTILDCIRGLQYAIKIGWFNYKTFNLAEYQHYEKLQNGDLNWIIPQKFVALSSPSDKPIDKYGNRVFTPTDYVPIFKKLGVTAVVRLNNKTYEAQQFKKNGIKHYELYFADGSVPSLEIVHNFIKLSEETKGALGVHCKAGLGRTGTLIACYAMKHYYFPAADFIGWIRIARPGSILGPQQNYLIEMERMMREEGVNSPIWQQIRELVDEKQIVNRMKNLSTSEMSERDLEIMKNGEKGQGQNLVYAKQKKESISKTPTYSKGHSSGGKMMGHQKDFSVKQGTGKLSYSKQISSKNSSSSSGKYSPSYLKK